VIVAINLAQVFSRSIDLQSCTIRDNLGVLLLATIMPAMQTCLLMGMLTHMRRVPSNLPRQPKLQQRTATTDTSKILVGRSRVERVELVLGIDGSAWPYAKFDLQVEIDHEWPFTAPTTACTKHQKRKT
jgi:hypothetical protein